MRLLGMSFSQIVIRIIAVFLCMTIHEMAHGLVSYWLGDPTAKVRGRLSLNPFAHIDWIGLASLLLFGFGWAKPVPIDSRYYKDQKSGIIWTSFAGPIANFILAFIAILIAAVLIRFVPTFSLTKAGSFLFSLLITTAQLSVGFGIFNLLPVPPLDGSKIFWAFLPDRYYYRYMNGNPAFLIVLLVLIYSGILSGPLSMLSSNLLGWMENICFMMVGLG